MDPFGPSTCRHIRRRRAYACGEPPASCNRRTAGSTLATFEAGRHEEPGGQGAIRFNPDELRDAVARTVRWQWPGERLLATVPCEAEWAIVRDPWSPDLWTGDPDLAVVDEFGREPGALGVTERRLLYRTDERHDLIYRLASWTFVGLAAIVFLVGELRIAALAGGLALLAGGLGRVVGVFGLGSGVIELPRALQVDHAHHRVHGADRWGVHYRLVLAEPDSRSCPTGRRVTSSPDRAFFVRHTILPPSTDRSWRW